MEFLQKLIKILNKLPWIKYLVNEDFKKKENFVIPLAVICFNQEIFKDENSI
jgi:hypothetical protein